MEMYQTISSYVMNVPPVIIQRSIVTLLVISRGITADQPLLVAVAAEMLSNTGQIK